ncbi:MAG: prepilin peptidase [Chloroflexi bacterium]|nr:prepilin peptidase [Chloroflexota bacterium]
MAATLAFVLGSAVGSFLNVVVDRIPAGGSLFRPRSRCGACGTPLKTIDLVPIVSYLLIRGRCRYCRTSIPSRLLAVEAITAALFLAAFLRFGPSPAFLAAALCGAVLIVIAASALETGRPLTHALVIGAVAAASLAPFWTEIGIPRGFSGHDGLAWSAASSVAGGAAVLITMAAAYATRLLPPRAEGVAVAAIGGLFAGFPGALVAAGAIALAAGFVYASGVRGKAYFADRRAVLVAATSSLAALPFLLIGTSAWP